MRIAPLHNTRIKKQVGRKKNLKTLHSLKDTAYKRWLSWGCNVKLRVNHFNEPKKFLYACKYEVVS